MEHLLILLFQKLIKYLAAFANLFTLLHNNLHHFSRCYYDRRFREMLCIQKGKGPIVLNQFSNVCRTL